MRTNLTWPTAHALLRNGQINKPHYFSLCREYGWPQEEILGTGMSDAECLAKRKDLLAMARLLPTIDPIAFRCRIMANLLLDMAGADPVVRCDAEQRYDAARREFETTVTSAK